MNEIHSNKQSFYSAKSNEQRLKSIELNEKEKIERKSLIKDSLSKKPPSKHFQFDSEDEEQTKKTFVQSKLKLFDDEDLTNFDQHFAEKTSSKKERQLQALQAKLTSTNDPRFKLSENFLDENPEISIEEEKNKSLAILEEMNNKKSSSKSKTKMIRFDPTKSEHQIYELKETEFNEEFHSSPNKFSKQTNSKSAPIVDSTRTFELKTNELKTFFDKTTKSTNGETFQFAFFQNEAKKPEISTNSTVQIISNGKRRIFPNQPEDSSSEDENQMENQSAENQSKLNGISTINPTFFFFDIDERLKEGLTSYVRTEDLAELEESWPNKRKEIAEALRSRHRKAVQRKEKRRVFNHRRRQQQQKQKNQSLDEKLDQD